MKRISLRAVLRLWRNRVFKQEIRDCIAIRILYIKTTMMTIFLVRKRIMFSIVLFLLLNDRHVVSLKSVHK